MGFKTNFVKREVCPACLSRTYEIVYSCGFTESPIREYLENLFSPVGQVEFEYLDGAAFILGQCKDCGTVFQQEIMDDFLQEKYYEEWIDPQKAFSNHEHSDDLYHLAHYAQEVMMLIAYFKTIPGQLKFFDFGMGWGKWCRMARAFGCDAYGTELSKARIEYAESQGIKVITWDEISEHRFDFINTEQVFEHIPEPFETLLHLKKSLKPKGLIKISVPNGNDIKKRLAVSDWTAPLGSRNSLHSVAPLQHINCFNHNSLIRMAEIAELELVKIPMTIQFASGTNWRPIKPMFKNIFRPLYRNTFQRGTYLFFRQREN
jgi:2-polyprenyl-3-methyl-5-hydroxy-6-metoxy-1,4-benzoquinol methylase